MIVLVGKNHHVDHPNVGRLVTPRITAALNTADRMDWACDNDAFLAWDMKRYVRMLELVEQVPQTRLRFITAPDVVGDHRQTLELFRRWHRRVRHAGPVGFVAQDGANEINVPWHAIDALFIGGTTRWKLSEQAESLISHANQAGKWTHIGRVNSRRRLRWAISVGADSIDGSGFARFQNAMLPWAIDMCEADPQGNLFT